MRFGLRFAAFAALLAFAVPQANAGMVSIFDFGLEPGGSTPYSLYDGNDTTPANSFAADAIVQATASAADDADLNWNGAGSLNLRVQDAAWNNFGTGLAIGTQNNDLADGYIQALSGDLITFTLSGLAETDLLSIDGLGIQFNRVMTLTGTSGFVGSVGIGGIDAQLDLGDNGTAFTNLVTNATGSTSYEFTGTLGAVVGHLSSLRVEVTAAPIPEPSSLAMLMMVSVVGLVARRRQR